MRKKLSYILISLVLFSCKNSNESITEENARIFNVDSKIVDEIYLSDTEGNKCHLVKKGNKWSLNDNYTARKDAIEKLLNTIEFVKYRNPVPDKAHDQAVKNLISKHAKIEIFSNGKAIMSYFIGGQSKDGEGTYMLKQDVETGENAEQVFITELPGFNGYLTPRYITTETLWRDRSLFSYEKGELASIKIEYPEASDESFELRLSQGNVSGFDLEGNEIEGLNQTVAKTYLINYKKVNFEAIATKDMSVEIDSLQSAKPLFIITATDANGKENRLVAHRRKPISNELQDAEGNPLEFDTDRLFGLLNGKEELLVIQYFVFDKLTVKRSYFINDPS